MFVLGGSWSGPKDLAKDAEVYDPTRGVWTSLLGIQAATILTDDPEDAQEGRNYRADNYGMFHSWSDGTGTFLFLRSAPDSLPGTYTTNLCSETYSGACQ